MKILNLFLVFLLLAACSRSDILINPGVILPEQKEVEKPSQRAIELNNQANALYSKLVIEKSDGHQVDFAEVFKLFDDAVKESPNYYQAYANKGAILLGLKKYSEAADAFSKALQLRPHGAEYYIGQAFARKSGGDLEKAKDSLRHAIAAFNLRLKNNPNDPSRLDRALGAFLLGYKKIALNEVNDILKKNPNDLSAKSMKEYMESGKDPWGILD